ncbi:Peptidylprolyl isomerase [Durusdinium trenchii]|uniref:Peptidylprolyl isomerase n=1 Tax=Durusdinium trenchii TaxID=1381693 RepID=A0ABP0QLF0_9DINO
MLHRLLSGSSLACLPFSDCRGNRVDMSPLLSLPEAAKYLTDVGGRLVVLAGTNHVWRDAIPERFERMTASRASAGDPPRKAVSVVPWRGEQLPPLGACDFLVPMEGPGGGEELAQDLLRQRERLRGQSRVFPAPPEARGKLESFDCKESSGDHWIGLDGRLPAKFTAESLIQVLDEITPGRYNFVYVPHDKRKLRNLALAFVNFSEPSAAQQAYDFFKNVKHPVMGPSVRVCQADIQGLGSNLAYFMARFGLQEMGNPHAPMVFENGVRQTNMVEAVKRHVTVDLLVQAHNRMEMQAMKIAAPQAAPGPVTQWASQSPASRRSSPPTTPVPASRASYALPCPPDIPMPSFSQPCQGAMAPYSFQGSSGHLGMRGNDSVPFKEQGRQSFFL